MANERPLDAQPRPALSARARLVAMVAGSVASGFTANPETSGHPGERIARWSVEVAEAILELAEANDNERERVERAQGGGDT